MSQITRSTGAVEFWHLQFQDTEKDQGYNQNYCITIRMQKPMLTAVILQKKLLLKNLCQFTQSCLQNSFQLVFYTSLNLRHCNTLSSINNSPTTTAKFPINVPTLSSYTLLYSSYISVKHVFLYFIYCPTPYSNFTLKDVTLNLTQ